ncbi:MAG: hypothetical protein ACTHN0_13160 [Aquihabitans sp.]
MATAAVATAAIVLAVLGTGGVAESQVAPPVVTASATDGMLTESGNCSGPSTFSLEKGTVSVSRTGDTTSDLTVDLAWSGSIDASVYGAPEALVIPAGETTTTFTIESGKESGTVTITIGLPSSFPGSYTVGDPDSATATIRAVIADPVCATAVPSTTTTTTSTPPSTQPPAAQPVTATADYTG